MTKTGTGESAGRNAFAAGVEAAEAALISGGMTSCDFTLVFATVGYRQEDLLRGVRSVTGRAPLAGCSGEGIITRTGPAGGVAFTLSGPDRGPDGVAVMAFSSDSVRFHALAEQGIGGRAAEAGRSIGRRIAALKADRPEVLLAFPDGYRTNTAEFFAGLEETVGFPLPMAGGMAGHNLAQSDLTYQYHDDYAFTNAVSAVLLCGGIDVDIGVNHGCLPLGIDKTITRARANVVYKIDDRPAWEFFQEYLADGDAELTTENAGFLSLGEKLPDALATEYDRYLIRAPFLKNPDGSIVFAAEIAEGARVRLMRRDEDKISHGTAALARRLAGARGGRRPLAVLQFDCAARGRMLFGDRLKEKEIDAAREPFGGNVPWIGVFCYGEIAPIGGRNAFHNQTVACCVLRERNGSRPE